jgi:large-conductance mechanosensitive channel
MPDAQSKFFTRRQDMRRIQLRQDGQRLNYWFATAQNAVFRHGESFSRVVGWSLVTMILFSFVYPLGGWIKKEGSTGEVVQVYTYDAIIESPVLLWESFNHSAQLFLTGGGPLKPTGTVAEMLMFVESLIAPILLALIVFVLGRRAAR